MTTQDEFSILSYIALNRPTEYALSAQPGFDYSHYHQLLDRLLVHVHPAAHVCTLTQSGMERFVVLKDLLLQNTERLQQLSALADRLSAENSALREQLSHQSAEYAAQQNRQHASDQCQAVINRKKEHRYKLLELLVTAFLAIISEHFLGIIDFFQKLF